jgi:hypothetical protein
VNPTEARLESLNETPQDVKALEGQIVHRFQTAGRECICRGAVALARDNQSRGLESPWRVKRCDRICSLLYFEQNAYDE